MAEKKENVSDFVMMSEITEEAVMKNLKNRFENDQIYTFIRDVVVSVNPYKQLNIYTKKEIETYRGKNIYELPPHIYSVADTAFLNLRDQGQDQCIIISGESGAGKTEASKLIMEYIAAVSGSSVEIDKVKSKLLGSNPLLEAFGNAKTTRNDNSSRFGKYMDLQFDFIGNPIGGMITTYLLEKSRVVNPAKDERTFHIFYHLLGGANKELLNKLFLTGKFEDYSYLQKSKCTSVNSLNDKKQFDEIINAINCIGITEDEKTTLFNCVAAVLHIGNIKFEKNEENDELTDVINKDVCEKISKLLGIQTEDLINALTYRTIVDKKKNTEEKNIKVPLNSEKAISCRDTLAKTLYERLFSWLVTCINKNIYHKENNGSHKYVIGVLDIYGFEIFKVNGFEQFTINYCNEKLQQLFIELTLKSEQEEYQNEGIEWKNIEYFNNQIICDLIEMKNSGIIALLNEECIRPGEKSDQLFLDKLNSTIIKHAHFDSREKTKNDKEMGVNNFKLKHYAGDVIYTVDNFIEKNIDSLYNDILITLNKSTNNSIREMFPHSIDDINMKLPETIGTQFKNSMKTLIKNLKSKTPHYIRCIKPNSNKSANLFDDELCLHQCRYLGLLENIRVRRAGYCFRQEYKKFLERFKILSKNTWPNWKGDIKKGIENIIEETKIKNDEYRFGKTKIFIKSPEMVFSLEDMRNEKKNYLATIIRARWLAYIGKKKYQQARNDIINVQSFIRTKIEVKKYRKTVNDIITGQKYVRGFICRKHMKNIYRKSPKYCAQNIKACWKSYVGRKMLKEMSEFSKKNTSNWNTIQWPENKYKSKDHKCTYEILKLVYSRMMAKKYRKALTPERKALLTWKLKAMELFKSKVSWNSSLKDEYKNDYLNVSTDKKFKSKWEKLCPEKSNISQSFNCTKFHRRNLKKEVPRMIVLTEDSLYLLTRSLGLKDKIPLTNITEIGCSTKKDGIIVIHCTEKKGDLVIRSDEKCIEAISQLVLISKTKGKNINVTVNDNNEVNNGKKTTPLEFSDSTSTKLSISPSKKKILVNVPK